MTLNRCKEIIAMNSSNRKYIQFEDFLYNMTRPAPDQDEVDSDTISVASIDSQLQLTKGPKIADQEVSISTLEARFRRSPRLG